MSDSIYESYGRGAWKLALMGITYLNNILFVQDPTGKLFYAGLLMYSLNVLYEYSGLASNEKKSRFIRIVGFSGGILGFLLGLIAFIVVIKYDNTFVQDFALNFNRYWFCALSAVYLCVIAIDIFYCFFSKINSGNSTGSSQGTGVQL